MIALSFVAASLALGAYVAGLAYLARDIPDLTECRRIVSDEQSSLPRRECIERQFKKTGRKIE